MQMFFMHHAQSITPTYAIGPARSAGPLLISASHADRADAQLPSICAAPYESVRRGPPQQHCWWRICTVLKLVLVSEFNSHSLQALLWLFVAMHERHTHAYRCRLVLIGALTTF
jgi:hypothetical protein